MFPLRELGACWGLECWVRSRWFPNGIPTFHKNSPSACDPCQLESSFSPFSFLILFLFLLLLLLPLLLLRPSSSSSSSSSAQESFEQVKASCGAGNSFFLQINSRNPASAKDESVPEPWSQFLHIPPLLSMGEVSRGMTVYW